LFWSACHREPRTDYTPEFGSTALKPAGVVEYRFGVEPMRSSRRLWERYTPFIRALNSRLQSFKLTLESAQTAAGYGQKLSAGTLDFSIVEPHRVLRMEDVGYFVFARTGRQDRVAGVVVVRRESGLDRPSALRGRTVVFGTEFALAPTMLVRMWLREAGVGPQQVRVEWAGAEESALMRVAMGEADAAGASLRGWRDFQVSSPHAASRLEPKWQTDSVSGPAVIAHRRVPVAHVRELSAALNDLSLTAAGQLAIQNAGYSDFRLTQTSSYDDVWEFLNAYARVFVVRGDRKGGRK
jgi:phosphonate transport system substrate-binding protein